MALPVHMEVAAMLVLRVGDLEVAQIPVVVQALLGNLQLVDNTPFYADPISEYSSLTGVI